jgi:NADPH:quinone reductase-like Zn-dependent oxidoreductase
MKAAQVERYDGTVRVAEIAEPELIDPTDVIVRIAGAGVCRTDVHIVDGGRVARAGRHMVGIPLCLMRPVRAWRCTKEAWPPTNQGVGVL